MSVCEKLATTDDVKQLKSLWHTAFADDSDEDIDHFFDCFFDGSSCLIIKDNDSVMSMLFLLETAVENAGCRYPVGYIYAGATHPSVRGKGYYRRLLSFAETEAKRRGLYALLLRPATPQLAESYRRMGFTVPLFCDEQDVSAASSATEKELTAQAFVAMRRQLLAQMQQPFVDWDERVMAYALRWCRAVSCAPTSCALYARDDDGVRVWDMIGEVVSAVESGMCRTAGAAVLTALLCPVDPAVPETVWENVYFGYGLE